MGAVRSISRSRLILLESSRMLGQKVIDDVLVDFPVGKLAIPICLEEMDQVME